MQAEKQSLEKQAEDLKFQWDSKILSLKDRNQALESEKAIIMNKFEQYKTEEEQKLKEAMRDLNNQIDKLNDQFQRQIQENEYKAKVLESANRELQDI